MVDVMNLMSMAEYDLFCLMKIIDKFENESEATIEDCQITLSEIYELIEGYFGYASDIESFVINEDGDITPHSLEEYEQFINETYKTIKELFIKEIYPIDRESYNKGYENGLMHGYNGRDRIADLEEDVQSYR